MKSLAPILTLLPLLVQASPHHGGCSSPCANITCAAPGAAHIIVTRGSTESVGNGILDPVASAIAAACPGSSVAANPYPALLDPYVASETAGLGNLTQMALDYRSCCGGGGGGGPGKRGPAGKMVFLGYSQGAQVTADFLCGRSEAGFGATGAYAADVADDVAAIAIVGDPSFVKGLPWDRGNASNGSNHLLTLKGETRPARDQQFFPRLDNAACLPVADKMISYCDGGDYFCDNGTSSDALAIHEGYAQKYGAQIVDYVVGKIEGCGADGGERW